MLCIETYADRNYDVIEMVVLCKNAAFTCSELRGLKTYVMRSQRSEVSYKNVSLDLCYQQRKLFTKKQSEVMNSKKLESLGKFQNGRDASNIHPSPTHMCP